MRRHFLININQVPALAQTLAKHIKGGEVLALVGPLGSGKTAFTQILGRALGIKQRIASPTFVLMQSFQIPKRRLWLVHLDLYRIKNFREAAALGLPEVWGKKNTLTVIEWADKIKKHLPVGAIFIRFKFNSNKTYAP